MSKGTRRNILLSKVIVTGMVCLFYFNSVSLAVSCDDDLSDRKTLQVRSIFNPILKEIGREYQDQLEGELAYIYACILDNSSKLFYPYLNGLMDEWYTDLPNKRLVILTANPVIDNGLITIKGKFLRGVKRGESFSITAACDRLEEVLDDIVHNKGDWKMGVAKAKEHSVSVFQNNLETAQIEAIKNSCPENLMGLLSGVKTVKIAKNRLSLPRTPPGTVETEMLEKVHIAAGAALSAGKFAGSNNIPALSRLANDAAAKFYVRMLRKTQKHKIKITLAEKQQRYVRNDIKEGQIFGDGDKTIETLVDALEGSDNVSRNEGKNVSSNLIFAEEGTLRRFPDELLLNGVITMAERGLNCISLDAPPNKEDLQHLADAQKDDTAISELKIIVPLGQRHKRLIDGLQKAGVSVNTVDYAKIAEEVNKNGIYENGNVLVVGNISMAFLRLVTGKAHAIIGADVPIDVAQIAFMIKAFGSGCGEFRFESYKYLKDNDVAENSFPDIYQKRKYSSWDLGILGRYGVFKDDQEIDPRRGQMHWSDTVNINSSQNDFVRMDNGVMISAGFGDCGFWVDGMEGPMFTDDMSEVTVSVLWVGLSGDVKVFKITYKTIIAELLKKTRTTTGNELGEVYYKLAKAYLEFGNIRKADEYITGALSSRTKEDIKEKYRMFERCVRIMKEMKRPYKDKWVPEEGKAFDREFFEFMDGLMKEMTELGGTETDPFAAAKEYVTPLLARLIRKINQGLGDACRVIGERALEGTNPDLFAVKATFEKAARYYKTAIQFFPKNNIMTGEEHRDLELYRALAELADSMKDVHLMCKVGKEGHECVQQFNATIFKEYIKVARLLDSAGYNKKGIKYVKKAIAEIKGLKDKGVTGILPFKVACRIPELYEKGGWWTLARDEYYELSEEKLKSIFYGNRTKRKFTAEGDLYMKIALKKITVGYLISNVLSQTAIGSFDIMPSPDLDSGQKIADHFKKRLMKEYSIFKKVGNKIYGIKEVEVGRKKVGTVGRKRTQKEKKEDYDKIIKKNGKEYEKFTIEAGEIYGVRKHRKTEFIDPVESGVTYENIVKENFKKFDDYYLKGNKVYGVLKKGRKEMLGMIDEKDTEIQIMMKNKNEYQDFYRAPGEKDVYGIRLKEEKELLTTLTGEGSFGSFKGTVLEELKNRVEERLCGKKVPKVRVPDAMNRSMKKTIIAIDSIHKKNREVFLISETYFSGKITRTGISNTIDPIDVPIDLSLLPSGGKALENNVKELAYLILRYKNTRNVNFILTNEADMLVEKDFTNSPDIKIRMKTAPKAETVQDMLKKEIEANVIFCADTDGLEDLVNNRIRITRARAEQGKEDPIEVPIMSREVLEWMRDNNVPLKDNQYPVAMEDIMSGKKDEIKLQNFEAAFAVAFAKASLVTAKRKVGRNEKGAQEEFIQLKTDLTIKLNDLYSRLMGMKMFDEEGEVLENMISNESIQRLGRAIDLYLPPIPHMNPRDMRQLYDHIHELLRYA